MSRRRPLYLLYIILILFLLIPILQDKSYSQELPSPFDQGIKALQKGDLNKAEEIFRAVLKSDPENSFAYFNLGSIFASTRRLDLALTALNRAVVLKPDLVAAHIRLAEIYEAQGNVQEAIREYEEAYLYLSEGSPQERIILSRIENLEYTSRLKEIWDLGITLFRKGSYQDSEAAFREVITLEPNNALAHYWLGTVLGVQNRFDDAIESFNASLRIKPNLTDSRTRLIELHQLKGNLAEARVEVEKALFFVEDRDGPEMQSLEEKLNSIEDQIEVKTFIDEALAQVEKNNIDGAISTFQSLLKIYPNQALAYFNIGNLWARKNRIDLAETSFKKAIEIQPDYSEAHQRLGQIYELVGYFNRAKGEYQKAQASLQKTDQFRGELDALVSRVEQQIKIADGSASGFYRESQKLLQENKVKEAIILLTQAISMLPEDPSLHYQLGELYKQNGEIDLAINEMLGVLEFDPGHRRARQQLGLMYEEKGFFYQAIKVWKEADALLTSDETTLHIQALEAKLSKIELETGPFTRRAEEKSDNGKWSVAIETLKQALAIAPDDIRIRIKLALLYIKIGNTIDAYRELNTVSLQDPSTGKEQYHLGLLYSSAGQWEDAKKAYESALKAKALLEGLRPKIQTQLEWVKLKSRKEADARRYFNRGNRYLNEQDYRKAIESFEKVTGFYPSDVASLYFIGFAYESLGEEDQARKYYRDVLKVNPMNLQAHQRLAFLYEKEGKVEKAIETYRNTLDFFGEEDSADVLWVKGRLSPLEKRYTVNLSQVLFAYDSNPSGVFNNGGDTYSAFSGTFNYYLKKDRLLQIPFTFSTDNTVFYRLNNILSNETLSVAATTVKDPYSLTLDYSFNFGVARGGPTSRGHTGTLRFFRRGSTPSLFGFVYSYTDFYSYSLEAYDAVRQRISLNAIHEWDVSSLTVSYSYYDNDHNANDQAYTSHGVGITYSRPILENLIRGTLSYNFEWKEFKNPDSFIDFIQNGRSAFRRNLLHTFSLAGSYSFQENLSLGLNYTEFRNQSNLPGANLITPIASKTGQAESLGNFRQRIINFSLNWYF